MRAASASRTSTARSRKARSDGERQDGSDGVHRIAPDPRPVPGSQHPGRRRQSVRGRARRDRDDRVRRRVRRHRRPAGRDHELSRPGRRPRRHRAGDPRRPRDGPCRPRASASRSTRIDSPATGSTADAVHGRDGSPLAARHAGGQADELKAREREYSQALQRDGRWPHLWRVAGRYANVSVLDVGSVDELHELLSGLPLFPYLDIRVTPLARHPNAIDRGESDA